MKAITLNFTSVADGLPADGVRVLAMVDTKIKAYRLQVLNHWTPGPRHHDSEAAWFDDGGGVYDNVTHWAALP